MHVRVIDGAMVGIYHQWTAVLMDEVNGHIKIILDLFVLKSESSTKDILNVLSSHRRIPVLTGEWDVVVNARSIEISK